MSRLERELKKKQKKKHSIRHLKTCHDFFLNHTFVNYKLRFQYWKLMHLSRAPLKFNDSWTLLNSCDTYLYFILSDINDIYILKHTILTRVSAGNNTIT